MDRKVLAVVFIGIVLIAFVGAVSYGYSNFPNVLFPQKSPLNVFSGRLEVQGKVYNINVESYLVGDPFLDVNTTLRGHIYKDMTIIIGDPVFRNCKSEELGNACVLRARTVTELSAVLAPVFTSTRYWYYVKEKGYNKTEALEIAVKDKSRIHVTSLGFAQKVKIGLGLLGNENHLLIVIIGPREGARKNRIYCPKRGILVLEGTSEEALFAEVLLLKSIIGSKVK